MRNLNRGMKGEEIGLTYFDTVVLKAKFFIKNLM